MRHLTQCFGRVFSEAGVEETVDKGVDGVVDEERLDAKLVGHLKSTQMIHK